MVRNYKRKTERKYSDHDLQAAVDKVCDGESLTTIARQYGIPPSSLSDNVHGRSKKNRGGQTVLSQKEEENIATALVYAAQYGWPQDRKDLAKMVGQYCILLKRKTPWNEEKGPGIDFIQGFEKRWEKTLSKRKTETLTTARKKAMSEDVIDDFFSMLSSIYDQHGLHDKRKISIYI
ncbi:MAG: hypothetical protein AAGK05_10365 [Pseudomonadota bacterium]